MEAKKFNTIVFNSWSDKIVNCELAISTALTKGNLNMDDCEAISGTVQELEKMVAAQAKSTETLQVMMMKIEDVRKVLDAAGSIYAKMAGNLLTAHGSKDPSSQADRLRVLMSKLRQLPNLSSETWYGD